MKTLAIIFFFTIAATFILQTTTRAQSQDGVINNDSGFGGTLSIRSDGSATIDGRDTVLHNGVIIGSTHPYNFHFDPKSWRGIIPFDSLKIDLNGIQQLQPQHFEHMPRYSGNSADRYFLEVVPPTQKGKRVDGSNIWLLNEEIPDAAAIPPAH